MCWSTTKNNGNFCKNKTTRHTLVGSIQPTDGADTYQNITCIISCTTTAPAPSKGLTLATEKKSKPRKIISTGTSSSIACTSKSKQTSWNLELIDPWRWYMYTCLMLREVYRRYMYVCTCMNNTYRRYEGTCMYLCTHVCTVCSMYHICIYHM